MEFLKDYIIFLQEDNQKIVEAIRKVKESNKIDDGYLEFLRKQLKKNNDELLKIAFINKFERTENKSLKMGGVR